MAELLGRREKPRALVIGVDPESDFGNQIVQLVPTVRFLEGRNELLDVRQSEWDVAVEVEVDAEVESHLFVLKFGGINCGSLYVPQEFGGYLMRDVRTVATEFVVAGNLPDDVARLVRNELAPAAIERGDSFALRALVRTAYVANLEKPLARHFVDAFLSDADGEIIAGQHARRGGNGSQLWTLPDYTVNRERWLAAALAAWRKFAPDTFPGEAAWSTRSEWRTPAEDQLASEMIKVVEEWKSMVAAHNQAVAALGVQLQESVQAGDENERRLLTAQGDDLVEEVIRALQLFGFDVVDVDAEISIPGDRREDIRVSDADEPEWIAIGEVRGYSKGAQLNDLLRLGRFVARFVRDEGREPSAVWYVVNHGRESDPSTRPEPLESNPDEVETFADGAGLVIDTRALFFLRKQVEIGQLSKADVRRRMRTARGRLGSASD